jgi:RNA polymerase sigma factor (sigma-70 family)
MTELSQADQYLIQQVQRGSQEGWSELVRRYQGRLVAFARAHLRDTGEAEDVVQETFLGFLKSVDRFQTRSSLETYLFTIVRRRLIDVFRRRGRRDEIGVCSLQQVGVHNLEGSGHDLAANLAGAEPSASWVAEQHEQTRQWEETLWQALRESISRLRQGGRFRDLQIFEMVFYAQMRNRDIARQLKLDEKQVALIKHRFIKRIAQQIETAAPAEADSFPWEESLLTRLWESHRPSCPKRSTVGKLLLGTLDEPWRGYVQFHIEQLGCRFCQANLEDLRHGTIDEPSRALCHRILQSSVGFLR